MVSLGLEPGVAGWKAQTNSLSYSGTQKSMLFNLYLNCDGERDENIKQRRPG